jgi:hypothetical protein
MIPERDTKINYNLLKYLANYNPSIYIYKSHGDIIGSLGHLAFHIYVYLL